MTKEHEEYIAALKELRNEVGELRKVMLELNGTLHATINHSHLRSTLTLLEQDIGLRRVLELI